MARSSVDLPKMSKTTIITYKYLLDRMSVHVAANSDSQTNFLTRAILNQLEREGDFSTRKEMEELYDYEQKAYN